MDDMLENKISRQRVKLESLIGCTPNLQDDDIIQCSEKMDKLINEYLKTDYNEANECFL